MTKLDIWHQYKILTETHAVFFNKMLTKIPVFNFMITNVIYYNLVLRIFFFLEEMEDKISI